MRCFINNQECIYESELRDSSGFMSGGCQNEFRSLSTDHEKRDGRIFVISPFGYPYDDIYDDIFLKFKEPGGFSVTRADRAVQLGFVMCQKVCKEIRRADYVFVDLSEPNPNVYYELGLSFGFGKKIVLLFGDHSYVSKPHMYPWIQFTDKYNRKILFKRFRLWLASLAQSNLIRYTRI